MGFLIVSEDDIKKGVTTDKYFIWTEKVLREKGINPKVVAEVTTSRWGIFAGLNDVIELLKGLPIDVYSMPEGCLFFPHQPVMFIEGRYLDFARFETPLLGLICHASGVATQAFVAKLSAGDRKVLSFGTRRQHPALSACIERSAYIGGVDGVSNFSAEKYLGINSIGTMPHALIISVGDQVKAWRFFDEVVSEDVPRTYLIDTYFDEKTEAVMVVENLERVDAVRLDTPSTRRGNMRKIIEEVRWELDIRNRKDVKIVLSGGLSVRDIVELRDLVDAFGVGTMIAGAKPIDFAMDIVERDGRFSAKRGKRGGKKQVYRDWEKLEDEVVLFDEKVEGKEPLLRKIISNGKVVEDTDMDEARKLALRQMEIIKKLGKINDFIE
ncbi:Nicotinic acid phosphoribosyltransferase [Archaeoglobus sulfaticallidus PM70-1]|uniref:Nicotinic acid phosphoribosyltransferase n=1 Tax=Archaeoglobus sulfaticallidus PM70-1 TaxID=387631 RepID=N0BE41_9EURY|nr:nicotinate phosphoribosyltransferase [Archaeoglobus sulfaticallidus]AGK61283.1 Nicotinic acid phosphoribosyltransferase [Archaeoglobus sulfaticallidus PM70-1]